MIVRFERDELAPALRWRHRRRRAGAPRARGTRPDRTAPARPTGCGGPVSVSSCHPRCGGGHGDECSATSLPSGAERDPADSGQHGHMPDPRRLRSAVGLVAVLIRPVARLGADVSPSGDGRRECTAGLDRRRQPLPNRRVHDAEVAGCGARRPGSRSSATSSTARPTTPPAASVATSTGCASGTATTCRCRRASMPGGWTAGLRHFVDDRYRLVSSRTFDGALRSAVTRLRQTGPARRPDGLARQPRLDPDRLPGDGRPGATSSFRVTSVRVTGPLYGLQSKNGYDMPPNTKLTTAQLKRYFTPWKYAPKPMVWDGRYVSIQPVPKGGSATSAATSPRATARPTDEPASERRPEHDPESDRESDVGGRGVGDRVGGCDRHRRTKPTRPGRGDDVGRRRRPRHRSPRRRPRRDRGPRRGCHRGEPPQATADQLAVIGLIDVSRWRCRGDALRARARSRGRGRPAGRPSACPPAGRAGRLRHPRARRRR